MVSELVVHSIPGSPYGRAVFSVLEEKGAAYRLAPVDGPNRKNVPHILLHPFGRIPVLDHDGFILYETQAILRYLDRILPHAALTPTAPQAAARMDQVMNICDWYLFQGVNNIIGFQRVIKPRLLNLPPDEDAISQAMPQARAVFDELGRLLGQQTYFAGEAVTLADLMVGPHLDFMSGTQEWAVLTDKSPNLVAWLARINERPSFRATTRERISALANAA